MEKTIPAQAQQMILSLQNDVMYYQRRAQEAQREISGILSQLGLQSVQVGVFVPEPEPKPEVDPAKAPVNRSLALVEKGDGAKDAEAIPAVDAARSPEGAGV